MTTSRARRGAAMASSALLMTLAACGNGPGGGSGGSDGDTVRLGAILSLSGTYSTLGPPEQKAMEMGVDAVNKAGALKVGDKTYKLDLKVIDDQSDAGTAGVAAYRQLASVDSVPVLAIGLGSANYQSVMARTPMPVMNVLDSTFPSILQYSDHLFLLRTDTPGYAPGCTWYAKNVLQAKKMAIIGAGADSYSTGLETWIKKSADAYGVQITATADYPAGTTDFAPFIQKAMASKPDAIYLGGVTAEQLPVLKQLRGGGVDLPVFHSSGVTPDQAQNILGDSLYVNMMKNNYDCAGTLPITSTEKQTLAFADAFQAATKTVPQDLTMWAYDYPWIVAKAMQQAGTVSDRDKIFQALNSMQAPTETISGWIAQGGKLFDERKAITASQIMAWCPDQKTIKPTLTYTMKDLEVEQRELKTNPCAG